MQNHKNNLQCGEAVANQESDLEEDENILKNGTQANKAAWTFDEDVVLIQLVEKIGA